MHDAAPRRGRLRRSGRTTFVTSLALLVLLGLLPLAAGAQEPAPDPRVGLSPGRYDAGEAISNLAKLSSSPLPEGFTTNSDLAFTGDYAISGNYSGFNVYDVSDPAAPVQTTSVLCPGSQNDVSVYGNLLFLSVEQTSARVDCSASTPEPGSTDAAVGPGAARFVAMEVGG